ncbi:MAG: citrate transporter [Betaproteobacteria bacterium]|jgi:Na+/H+ antiporter NhaD/arsenite permease-like protein
MSTGIPFDFILFALTLAGVALFHRHTLGVAVAGLCVIVAYKLIFTGFAAGPGVGGLIAHLAHEWVVLANLFGLLVGFALLAAHFHDSHAPEVLPRFLPDDWKGGFVLLLMVFVLSSFLDNIAAAVIGGTMASAVFRGKVHLGYLVAIVAASNAGGSGSVVGDTTTTMMWIAGVNPASVLHAYVAAAAAMLFFGVVAARQQQRYAPIAPDPASGVRVDWVRLGIVGLMLLTAIAANITINVGFAHWADRFPFIGAAIWSALLVSVPVRQPAWKQVPNAVRGSVFLLSLVLAASLMPVETLPAPSWQTALGLGYISAVFDNIPLTALALKQGGHDWSMLAYAVGFGGSMIWFGSSAGVALSNLFPESRSVGAWIRQGWHVAVAYPLGFFALLWVMGWQPEAARAPRTAAPSGNDSAQVIDRNGMPGRPQAPTFLPTGMASR